VVVWGRSGFCRRSSGNCYPPAPTHAPTSPTPFHHPPPLPPADAANKATNARRTRQGLLLLLAAAALAVLLLASGTAWGVASYCTLGSSYGELSEGSCR
jgi:hypothetical protein